MCAWAATASSDRTPCWRRGWCSASTAMLPPAPPVSATAKPTAAGSATRPAALPSPRRPSHPKDHPMSIPSDPLLDFAHQYLRDHPVCSDFIGHGPLSRIGAVSGQLLYREGPYQVEVFSVPPDYIVPAHTHPDVDSIEVYLSGSIKFSHSGSFVFQTEQTVRGPDDGSYAWRMLRIRPQDMHGAVTGTSAARFISIQHWLNGTPPTRWPTTTPDRRWKPTISRWSTAASRLSATKTSCPRPTPCKPGGARIRFPPCHRTTDVPWHKSIHRK